MTGGEARSPARKAAPKDSARRRGPARDESYPYLQGRGFHEGEGERVGAIWGGNAAAAEPGLAFQADASGGGDVVAEGEELTHEDGVVGDGGDVGDRLAECGFIGSGAHPVQLQAKGPFQEGHVPRPGRVPA